jgi:lipopolysaccharide/colanic/teichoic acid biosynthesis glycosyltransferase
LADPAGAGHLDAADSAGCRWGGSSGRELGRRLARRAAKRAFDVVAGAAALAVLAGPMLLIALAIRLGSHGPAIFRQRRVGRGGRPFTMLKFRTMRADADAYGSSPRAADDPRLTRLGRWLRERSLDELPQLLNVLAGQMSLVGPRPLYERQAALWDERQRHRLDVRPGISGYAQAFGRGAMALEDKIEFDLYYVANADFRLDMAIVFRTVANVLTRRGADTYERRYSRRKERETD